ncbi:histidine kinase [Kitasatospora sp. NBC_01287]|uniref:sensor histidine kinase n=1 Tax=Kitasatospora sp. NBC_01287 TaxID=2903573 RepID=UPI00224F6A6D|nr:histidine kinase [Kitasatospora sp. NBC_01287]MCX4745793.1 histidine kinase [Kitasatospora sp. NBC_01287]
MSSTEMTAEPRAARRGAPTGFGRTLLAAPRGLALLGVALGGAGVLLAVPLLILGVWVATRIPSTDSDRHAAFLWLLVPLVPGCALAVRGIAVLTRRLAEPWCGVAITAPYRPMPAGPHPTGLRPRLLRWARRLLTDPATWRDLAWTAVTGCASMLVLFLSAWPGFLTLRVLSAIFGVQFGPVGQDHVGPRSFSLVKGLIMLLTFPFHPHSFPIWGATFTGLLIVVFTVWAGPRVLYGYGLAARSLLGPTQEAELALRVRHLAATRSDTIDFGAAELRRIERDLHDGAQARLVAMGMTLSAAESLFESDPGAARALVSEAKGSSAKALAELRDLVRGIHPPVLADRGLVDAVRALALDLPLKAHFSGELTNRLPAAIESAAYFAVNELLANITKHAQATQTWIEIGHTGSVLRISVTDDGRGGADPAQGTGLRGLERRLAAFDGILAVSSPLGGPTIANLEIPCASSSPKTSSS